MKARTHTIKETDVDQYVSVFVFSTGSFIVIISHELNYATNVLELLESRTKKYVKEKVTSTN